jgi:TonB family protein
LAVEHFSKDGLSFDYPAGWTLEDKSSEQVQHLVIRRAGSSVLVMVIAQREPIRTVNQMLRARDAVTMPYVVNLARQLGAAQEPSREDAKCLPLGERFAVGFRLAGRLEQQSSTGEVYAVVLGQRLVHLVHVRADVDDAQGAPVWKSIFDTLKIEPPVNPSPEAKSIENSIIVMGGGLNGKATVKPQPEYPPIAKAARVQGTVVIEIVVDEEGKVISAKSVSGHPLLQQPGENAARHAKFTPTTLCGRPVKVSGVVTYNFILR